MPRHLIGDAHEWVNEISTVPFVLNSSLQVGRFVRCRISGRESFLEIPLLIELFGLT